MNTQSNIQEDPYIWMENLNDPKLIKWIEEENAKFRNFVGDFPKKLQKRIEKYYEIPSILQVMVTDIGYYMLVRDKKSFKIILLRRDGTQETIVDSSELGKDIVIHGFNSSDDGKLLAFIFAYAGADVGTTRIIRSDSKEVIDEIKDSIYGIIWLDERKYYYVKLFRKEKTPDGIPPPTSRVFLRENGKDYMIFGKGLPQSYFVGISKSKTADKVLLLVNYGWTRSTFYGGDLRNPETWTRLYGGADFVINPIDYVNGEYILISYEGEGLGKIIAVKENGDTRLLVEEKEFPLLYGAYANNRLFIIRLVHAVSTLRIYDLNGKLLREIRFNPPGTISSFHSNGKEIVFKYESFYVPYRIYKIANENLEIIDSKEISGDFVIEEDFAESFDKTKIHIFIVKRRNSILEKVLAYGYGGFGIAITPRFYPPIIPFLEDGGVFVVANLRGGSEYGEKWHRAGMRENKQNVFNDFIAVITKMKKLGAKVVAMGRSNGGLLVGAVMTQRPDILDGAVIGYPVLDMLRFHKLLIGAAWIPEYGNPNEPKDRKFLLKYSPYHNVKAGVKYPPTLVYTGLHDDRVHPAHAFKFVAKLKEVGAPVYLRTETASGHAGASPERKIREDADILAFIYKILGMSPQKS